MNIANQGFPATRADLNNALQAIATNNSGTSAPSTTFANQWWYDESNNKLYIRNEANNAWIQVAVLDQTNNEWQITTGVIQAKDSDGLALKTDDGTTRLFIKDSDGRIGIGTSSPPAPLSAHGTGPQLNLYHSTTGNLGANFHYNGTTGNLGIATNGVNASSSPQLMLDLNGNFDIVNTGQASLNYTTDGTTDYARITGGKSGSGVGDLRFFTYSGGIAERVRILSGGGLTFNGDTAAANALNDYEEGTWNAVANVGSVTEQETSRYVKIGQNVTIFFDLRAFNNNSNSGSVFVSGLPYTCTSRSANGIMHRYWASDGEGIVAFVSTGATTLEFISNNQNNWDTVKYTDNNNVSLNIFSGSLTYRAS